MRRCTWTGPWHCWPMSIHPRISRQPRGALRDRALAFLLVEPVEDRLPRLPAVARRLPELPHGAVGVAKETELMEERRSLSGQGESVVYICAGELKDAALRIDPHLMPLLVGPIEVVETLSGAAVACGPVLVDQTAVFFEGHVVGACLLGGGRDRP